MSNDQKSINNTEHTCAGRTDGYGGFTCVKCGEYHEAERYKKSQPIKLTIEVIDHLVGISDNSERLKFHMDLVTIGLKQLADTIRDNERLREAATEALRRLQKGAPGWGVAKDVLNAALHVSNKPTDDKEAV